MAWLCIPRGSGVPACWHMYRPLYALLQQEARQPQPAACKAPTARARISTIHLRVPSWPAASLPPPIPPPSPAPPPEQAIRRCRSATLPSTAARPPPSATCSTWMRRWQRCQKSMTTLAAACTRTSGQDAPSICVFVGKGCQLQLWYVSAPQCPCACHVHGHQCTRPCCITTCRHTGTRATFWWWPRKCGKACGGRRRQRREAARKLSRRRRCSTLEWPPGFRTWRAALLVISPVQRHLHSAPG